MLRCAVIGLFFCVGVVGLLGCQTWEPASGLSLPQSHHPSVQDPAPATELQQAVAPPEAPLAPATPPVKPPVLTAAIVQSAADKPFVAELHDILVDTNSVDAYLVTSRLLSREQASARSSIPLMIRNAERLGIFDRFVLDTGTRAAALSDHVAGIIDKMAIQPSSDGVAREAYPVPSAVQPAKPLEPSPQIVIPESPSPPVASPPATNPPVASPQVAPPQLPSPPITSPHIVSPQLPGPPRHSPQVVRPRVPTPPVVSPDLVEPPTLPTVINPRRVEEDLQDAVVVPSPVSLPEADAPPTINGGNVSRPGARHTCPPQPRVPLQPTSSLPPRP